MVDAFQTMLWELDVSAPKLDVVVRGSRWRFALTDRKARRLMQNGSEIGHFEAFLHSGRCLRPSTEACQGRTHVRRVAVESLDELGAGAILLLRRNAAVCSTLCGRVNWQNN